MDSRAGAVFLTLVCATSGAWAKPRAAFVNVAQRTEVARAVIEGLRAEVVEAGYALVASGALRAALEEPVSGSQAVGTSTVALARGLLAEAYDAYAGFRYEVALARVTRIDDLLAGVVPTPEVVAVFAELHLLAGLVHAGADNRAGAISSWRLACRLSPERAALDPGKYRPSVVQLYAEACHTEASAKTVTVYVGAEVPGAWVWLDGRLAGEAPVVVRDVVVGEHYVVAGGADYQSDARKLTVHEGNGNRVVLQPSLRPVTERVRRQRRELLASAGDSQLFTRGVTRVAELASVELLIVVRDGGAKGVEAALFHVTAGRLGPWMAAPSTAFSVALRPAVATELSVTAGPPDPARREPSWYKTWWGVGLLVGGGALLSGAAIYAATSGGDSHSYTISGWCFEERGCE